MEEIVAQEMAWESQDGHQNCLTVFGSEGPKAILLISPAMGVRAAYYIELAKALAGAGFVAVLMDHRGLGHSSLRASRKVDWGYEDMILQDFPVAIQRLKSAYPSLPVYLLGHSLGGQLSCLFASRFPGEIDGIILVACCSVYWKGWPGFQAPALWLTTQFYGLVTRLVGYFPGPTLKFGGLEPRTEMRDWSNQARTGRYELTGSDFDYEAALGQLRLPVCCLNIDGDRLAPASAAQHLLDKFGPGKGRTPVVIGSEELPREGLNHFKWAKFPDWLVKRVSDFVGAV